MTDFNRVVQMFVGIPAQPLDEQILLLCQENAGCVRISDVLSQFKYCLRNLNGSKEYAVIRSYLVNVFSEEIVHGLEEL